MNKKKVAVVGYGGMGKWHVNKLLESDVATVAGIFDISEKRKELAIENGIHVYSSLDEVLSDESVDIITVATPNDRHMPIAIKAMEAGACAIVSPGTNPKVVDHCNSMGYPIIPGVCTPTEVEMAMSHGLSYLKFFPAEAAGGVKMISAMSAPYGNIKFMPTGGINLANVSDYLKNKAVFACGGSWMVPANLINEGKFDEIEALASDASALVKEIRK